MQTFDLFEQNMVINNIKAILLILIVPIKIGN